MVIVVLSKYHLDVKSNMYLSILLYPILDISSAWLSPTSLICHQWISHNPPYIFSFDAKCIKRTAKLPFSRVFSQFFDILLLSLFSVWLK